MKLLIKNVLPFFVIAMMVFAVGCSNDLDQNLPEVNDLPSVNLDPTPDNGGLVIDNETGTDAVVVEAPTAEVIVVDPVDNSATEQNDATVDDSVVIVETESDATDDSVTVVESGDAVDNGGEAAMDSGEVVNDGGDAAVTTDNNAGTEATESTDSGAVVNNEGDAPTSGEAVSGADNATQAETTTDPQAVRHVILAGQTVGIIAQQYGVSIQDIVVANNLINENAITAGDTLLIVPGAAEAAGVSAETAQFDPNNYFIHVVSYGETLGIIARRYGFDIQELAEYNNIANVNRIDLFQEIKIPVR